MSLMSQTSENLLRSFFVRCSDVGLDCNCIIFGNSEETAMDTMTIHMYEYHAINPEEMTTCMRLKIREYIHPYRDFVAAQSRNNLKMT
jgi:predicted small metal-binding protein